MEAYCVIISYLATGTITQLCLYMLVQPSFLFFRHQGFRMIIFDRQAGPLQNFNRSHVMVIGRSVSFSDPGRPKHPKIPPPPSPKKQIVHAFQNPRSIFEEKKLVGEKT